MLLPPPRPLAEIRAALRRARPRCIVHAASRADHALQIYAGLHALHAAGDLSIQIRRSGEPRFHGVLVELAAGKVFFDVRDGPDYYPVAAEMLLYAKRSFRAATAPANAVPLGLNYMVHPRRLALLGRRLPFLYRAVRMPDAPPPADLAPRALFLARTWDPAETGLPAADMHELNGTRAECIRALRKAFGARFLGGFARSAYTLRHFPDCAVPETLSTRRGDYLRLLRSFPIGIATTGLSDSIGWKFAEYVALSRAIVCEPLRYDLPGAMSEGSHYLAFATPSECVEKVGVLLDDREARTRLMQENQNYWKEYGTPAAVVARALHTALQRS